MLLFKIWLAFLIITIVMLWIKRSGKPIEEKPILNLSWWDCDTIYDPEEDLIYS